MKKEAKSLLPAALACALMAACSPAGDDPGPGPVSSGEAEAPEQAAEMLDEQRMPAEAEAAAAAEMDAPPAE